MQKEKVRSETIARTISLFIALINQALAIFGKEKLPFTDNETYQFVSMFATIILSLINWWKNNSFTQPAIRADNFMDKLRK